MAETKATVRRLPVMLPARTGNKNILNRRLRNLPFKIKMILPETKTVAVKKNGQTIREMTVRRKTKYFSGKSRLQF